jgi:hypothetical protein
MRESVMEEKKELTVTKILGYVFLILAIHVAIILLIGLVIVLLHGISRYFIWVVAGGCAFFVLSILLFFRKLRKDREKLKEMLRDPAFQGKTLEISFLGGLASCRVSSPGAPGYELDAPAIAPQLEDPHTVKLRELQQIAQMLEKNLISESEYTRLKNEILQSYSETP